MAANHHILLHDVVSRRRGMPQHKPKGLDVLGTQHSVKRANSPQATTPLSMADNQPLSHIPTVNLLLIVLGALGRVQHVRYSAPQLVAAPRRETCEDG